MKINKKYSTLLFAVLMSTGMSFSMSLILTLVNTGFGPSFFERWMWGFAIGFLAAFPTSLLIIPVVRKIVDKLTSD